ncbi:AraC family transcriptional regulator [Streptomyces sp. NPDC057375]|uniref:AraC family transcriptional regulator n=1 Tax=Streptomyces sp. NPDC057375 TaxID=3346109 RepID=UPI003641BF9C
MGTYICPMDFARGSRGMVQGQITDTYHLGHWRSEASTAARRTPGQVRHDPLSEHYQFLLLLSGSIEVDWEGQVETYGSSAVTTLATDLPLDMSMTPCEFISLRVPRAAIDSRIRLSVPFCAAIAGNKGLGRVAASMIYNLHKERANLTEEQFNGVCDQIAALLCMIAEGDKSAVGAEHPGMVSDRVRRYIRKHASSPTLSIQQVGADLGWSTRQIQAALQQEQTTYRDLVQEARLEVARERLASPQGQRWSIADVAASCGLSPGRLSVIFKARYGESPREFRMRMALFSPDRERQRPSTAG